MRNKQWMARCGVLMAALGLAWGVAQARLADGAAAPMAAMAPGKPGEALYANALQAGDALRKDAAVAIRRLDPAARLPDAPPFER